VLGDSEGESTQKCSLKEITSRNVKRKLQQFIKTEERSKDQIIIIHEFHGDTSLKLNFATCRYKSLLVGIVKVIL